MLKICKTAGRLRKTAALAAAVLMLTALPVTGSLGTVTAYADDPEEQAAENSEEEQFKILKDSLDKKIQDEYLNSLSGGSSESGGTVNTDNEAAVNAIKAYITKNARNEFATKGATIDAGKDIIYHAAEDAKDKKDKDGHDIFAPFSNERSAINTFRNLWYKEFKSQAESYGLMQEDGKEDTTDSSAKYIGLLFWQNSDNPNSSTQAAGIIKDISKTVWDDHTLGFQKAVQSVAVAMAIAFFMMSLSQMSSGREVTASAVTKEFAKLGIGIWVIMNAQYIAIALMMAASQIIGKINAPLTTSGHTQQYYAYKALTESLTNVLGEMDGTAITDATALTQLNSVAAMNVGSGTGIVSTLVNLITGPFTTIGCLFAVFSVIFELVARYIFVTIAVADLFSERFHSSGIMYLKKFLACALTGGVMMIMFIIRDVIAEKTGLGTGGMTTAAMNLTLMGMLTRARQIADDAVGAH